MEISSLVSLEGNSQCLDGGAMFGVVPKALWTRWMTADEHNRIHLACRALLLTTTDDRRILFETGVGAFFGPAMRERYGVQESQHVLMESLADQGLSDADIDIVVLSHLHFDHAGGMLSPWCRDEPYRLLFPEAEIWTGQEQWDRACDPHSRDRASYIPELQPLLEQSGRLRLLGLQDNHPLEPLVRFTFSGGHTPGLMLSHITTPQGPLVFCSDLIPGKPWVHLPVCMGYDRYPEQLINEKKALLQSLLETGGALFFTHDPGLCAGRVCRDEKHRFSVIPVALQELCHAA